MKKIPLTKGYAALVDDEDYETVNQFKWYPFPKGNTVYARCNRYVEGKRRSVSMHRLILNFPPSHTDHINGDGLNNQRQNLRLCSPMQNHWNEHTVYGFSRFRGVCLNKSRNKWVAQARINKKLVFLGHFDNETDAARAYDRAILMERGNWARTNFPKEEYGYQ